MLGTHTHQGSGLRRGLGSTVTNLSFFAAKPYGPGLKSRLRTTKRHVFHSASKPVSQPRTLTCITFWRGGTTLLKVLGHNAGVHNVMVVNRTYMALYLYLPRALHSYDMDMLEYPIFMDASFRVSPLPFACRPWVGTLRGRLQG